MPTQPMSKPYNFVRRFLQILPHGKHPCFGLTDPVRWLVQDFNLKKQWHAWCTKIRLSFQTALFLLIPYLCYLIIS